MPPISPLPLTTVERWRAVACDFPGVRWCQNQGTLGPDFEPADLAKLRKKSPEWLRGVFSFLLHIWNSANRFDLAEIQRWDQDHISSFIRWAQGSANRPCHYF